jgi:hypothetical protein
MVYSPRKEQSHQISLWIIDKNFFCQGLRIEWFSIFKSVKYQRLSQQIFLYI